MAREDEIRVIAYKIWEEEGRVDGHDGDHWFRAEAIWEREEKEKSPPRLSKEPPGSGPGQKRRPKAK